jgi:hypothetical protein
MRLASLLRRLWPPSPADLLLGSCAALAVGLYAWSRDHWWPPMPWGLTNIWWDLPPQPEFRSLEVSVEIASDVPEGCSLYIAPVGLAWLGDTPFYGGLLAGAPLPGGKRGRIALFSRWHERRPDFIRAAPGGFSQSAGHEGDFIGVRRPVPWRRGRYAIRFAVIGRDPDGRGTWIGQSVRDEASGARWLTGALCFPGDKLRLRAHMAAFIEMFGAPIRPRDIPAARLRFGKLRINGIAIPLRRTLVRYKATMPPFARVQPDAEGAVTIETGRRFRRAGLAKERGSYTERLG